MVNEEIIYRLNMMQQEAGKIEEQISVVNQQMQDFEVLKESLGKIENSEEMLANLGKGVFVKTKVLDKKLFVNIGNNIILKKNAKETKETIERQIVKLESLKRNLYFEIEHINNDMMKLIEEVQSKSSEN